MTRDITIPDGETVKLVDDSQPQGRYEFEVKNNKIRLSDRRADAPEGRPADAGRPGYFVKDKRTEAIYGHAPNGEARIEVEKSRFEINLYAPMVARAGRQNRNSLESFTHDPSSDGAQLPDNDVPDGYEVVVQASYGNADASEVTVGTASSQDTELKPGDSVSLGVSNTNDIHVSEGSAGDVVNVIFEA